MKDARSREEHGKAKFIGRLTNLVRDHQYITSAYGLAGWVQKIAIFADVRNCINADIVHSDAFFRSQRDINRHGSWLDFWKIQVNLVNFISGTFGTAWDKYSKNGLTFGCLREKKGWNFDLEIIFFKQKQDFGIFI